MNTLFTMALQSKLIVYRSFVGRGCYAWSPFVTKLETRLRLAGVKYDTQPGSLSNAPRGKVPYISIEDTSEVLSDSTLIARDFVERGYFPDLNARLAPAQKALDLAIRSLLEDRLYFYSVRERWVDNYYTMRDGILVALPWPMRAVIGLIIFRTVSKTLQGQGALRYTAEEVVSFRLEGLEALNALLSQARAQSATDGKADRRAPFWLLGGQNPTEADPTVFGFIVSCMMCPASPASQKALREFPVLLDYAQRIHDHYFSDYDVWK